MNKAIYPPSARPLGSEAARPAARFAGRRGWITIISASILLLCSICSARYSGGSGEPNDPYRIATAADLNDIGNHIEDFNKSFILLNDVNLAGFTGTQFRIIGDDSNRFTGLFDGNNYTILKFTWSSYSSRSCVGLFGSVGKGGQIRNLAMEDVNVSARNAIDRVAALAGYNEGTVSNCSSTGIVVGTTDAGGLIGYNNGGTVTDCYSRCIVSTGSSDYFGGGLAGTNVGGTITNCYSSGTVLAGNCCGGLMGLNFSGRITKCYSSSNVWGNSYVGGLVGDNEPNSEDEDAPITQCYSKGQVEGNLYVGGLVGDNGYLAYNCTITNCYSNGGASGDYVGGLVGYNWDGAVIDKSYSTGQVSGTNTGGLVGNSNCNLVTASFWDTQTSGMTTSCGGIGKTTAQMKTKSTYTVAGWDFVGGSGGAAEGIWDICQVTNYPRLVWQKSAGDFRCPEGVELADYTVLAAAWLSTPAKANWNPACDISEPNDGVIDEADLGVLCNDWLVGK